ncbi:MAG: hypothetical protein QXY49_02325 [Thermofilaceae archaeon]
MQTKGIGVQVAGKYISALVSQTSRRNIWEETAGKLCKLLDVPGECCWSLYGFPGCSS